MKAHTINKLDNFIKAWYLEDTSICDWLINYHNTSPNKQPGVSSYKNHDTRIKDSVDVALDKQGFLHYFNFLKDPLQAYVSEYPACSKSTPFSVTENVQIQHYLPGGGFHAWHSERTTSKDPIAKRHLVFMTYLNDVTDCGETQFYHQDIKIKPEKGLTVIWPVDWTFLHRGIPSPTQEKYILTGWTSYLDQPEESTNG
jgi:hypothetical protein